MKEHYLPEIRNSRLEPRKSNLDLEAILEKVLIPKVSKNFGELARDPPSLFLHWPRVRGAGAQPGRVEKCVALTVLPQRRGTRGRPPGQRQSLGHSPAEIHRQMRLDSAAEQATQAQREEPRERPASGGTPDPERPSPGGRGKGVELVVSPLPTL